jgi:hypothetical protein
MTVENLQNLPGDLQIRISPITGREETYFTSELRATIPKGLEELDPMSNLQGLWLVTEQAQWLGFPSDEERLRLLFQNNETPYGQLAWQEIKDRLEKIYGLESTDHIQETLSLVRKVHNDLLAKSLALPPQRQSYYHNVSPWNEGTGHANQVTINAARELVGALELGELNKSIFTPEDFGLVLMAMTIHDADWSVASSKAEIANNAGGLFKIPQDSLIEVAAIATIVDYSTDTASLTMRATAVNRLVGKWGPTATSIIYSILPRADFLQVGDINYPELKSQLVTDFILRKWEYVARWGVKDHTEKLEANIDFYRFASRHVITDESPWRYYQQFYGSGNDNLALLAWQNFEEQVAENDPDGWAKYQAEQRQK